MRNPIVTITENAFGHLHIWKGSHWVIRTQPANHTIKGNKESPIYLQSESEKDDILNYLSKNQRKNLSAGWTIRTSRIPADLIECITPQY